MAASLNYLGVQYDETKLFSEALDPSYVQVLMAVREEVYEMKKEENKANG